MVVFDVSETFKCFGISVERILSVTLIVSFDDSQSHVSICDTGISFAIYGLSVAGSFYQILRLSSTTMRHVS